MCKSNPPPSIEELAKRCQVLCNRVLQLDDDLLNGSITPITVGLEKFINNYLIPLKEWREILLTLPPEKAGETAGHITTLDEQIKKLENYLSRALNPTANPDSYSKEDPPPPDDKGNQTTSGYR